MGPNRPDELRFTFRRVSILVASFAVISGVLVPVLRRLGSSGVINPTLMLLLLSPWVLGFLVLMLDRKGPVKYWAVPLLVSLMAPALVVCHDWLLIRAWVHYGTFASGLATLVINVVLIGAFTAFLASMSPNRCPRCGRWAPIPLLNSWGREKRIAKTRWCGACGSKYWRRHKREDWKVERRLTWVDAIGKGGKSGQAANRSPTPVLDESPGASPPR